MKIAVWGADTFVGSNICNYMLQYTRHDIFGVFTSLPPYKHMEGPIRSRSRFDWQLTTKDTDAALARLKFESPDIVIIPTAIPECLVGCFDTCYVGEDTNQFGATRTFLTPEPFGPRQPKDTGIAGLIFSDCQPADNRKTVIYVKDLYDQFMTFLESGSKFGSASGTPTTAAEIWRIPRLDKIPNTALETAVLHTVAWYSSNTWFK